MTETADTQAADTQAADPALDALIGKLGEVIADIRDAHPRVADDVDSAFVADALRDTITGRCLVFPTKHHKAWADAAIARDSDRILAGREVDKILRLGGPGRKHSYSSTVLPLGDGCYVVQTHNVIRDPDVCWQIVLYGERISELYLDLDVALLAYVGLKHNGGNISDRSYEAAARVLRVPEED